MAPKAVVVCLDGVRPDALLIADTPRMKGMLQRGRIAYSFHAQCDGTPVSLPSWASTLTGVPQDVHGNSDNDGTAAGGATPSFLRTIKQKSPSTTACAHLCGWNGVGNVLEGGMRADPYAPLVADGTVRVVDELHEYRSGDEAACTTGVCAAIGRGFDVTVMYLDGPDRAGNTYGFAPHVTPYTEAIAEADHRVGFVIDAVRARRLARPDESWVFVLTTDHGGTTRSCMPPAWQQKLDNCRADGYGVHGLREWSVHRNAFLVVDEQRCSPGDEDAPPHTRTHRVHEILPPPSNMDVAATMLVHFGVPVPPTVKGTSVI